MNTLIATLMLLMAIPSIAQQKTLAGKWTFSRLVLNGDTLFNKNDTFVYYRNYKAKIAHWDSLRSPYVLMPQIPSQPTDAAWYKKIHTSFSAYYVDFLAGNKMDWGFYMNPGRNSLKGFYTMDWEEMKLQFYSDSLHQKFEAQFFVNIENATLQLTVTPPRGPVFWFTRSK